MTCLLVCARVCIEADDFLLVGEQRAFRADFFYSLTRLGLDMTLAASFRTNE